MTLSSDCYGQTQHVDICKEYNSFFLGKKLITNLNYSITNHESSPIWVWFSRSDESLMSDSLKIRKYFRLKAPKADCSYYQLMCDGNVDYFISSLFSSWVKVIQPEEMFHMTFVDIEDNNEQRITDIISSHLNIVKEENVIRQCPGVNSDHVKKQFTCNTISISIPWKSFVKKLSN